MSYLLYLQTAAISDLQAAFDWYETQKSGLGHEFLNAIGEMLKKVEQSPMIFAQVHNLKRRAALQQFPYNIIYAIEGNTIRVSAIMHGKQDPKQWKKRR